MFTEELAEAEVVGDEVLGVVVEVVEIEAAFEFAGEAVAQAIEVVAGLGVVLSIDGFDLGGGGWQGLTVAKQFKKGLGLTVFFGGGTGQEELEEPYFLFVQGAYEFVKHGILEDRRISRESEEGAMGSQIRRFGVKAKCLGA